VPPVTPRPFWVLEAQRFFIREHGPVFNTYAAQGYVAFCNWHHGWDSQRKGNRGGGYFAEQGITDWLTERT
jgi:hypothetical protein